MFLYSLEQPRAQLLCEYLADGEKTSASGRRALEAYVISFEVEAVLGRLMNPRHYQSGWHCTSTIGTIGTAAACARLLALDAKQTANCLGIAASSALGLKENFGTMTKPLHAGLAAKNAVLAALFAQAGLTASERAIEGPQGLLVAMESEHQDYEDKLKSLGERWEILEPGMTVKLYPSCAATHPALDAVLDLRREHNLAPEQIERVAVEVDNVTPNLLIYPSPQTGLEGKFSMQFCVAAALVDGNVGLGTFESRLQDSRIQDLLPRVGMRVNEELGENAPALTEAVVTIHLRDGRQLTRRANGARGYPEHPANAAELETKFRICARRAISEAATESALDGLRYFSELPSVEDLTHHLAIQS